MESVAEWEGVLAGMERGEEGRKVEVKVEVEVVIVVELGGCFDADGVTFDAGVVHSGAGSGVLEGIGNEQEVETGAEAHLQNVDILIVAQASEESAVFEEDMATFVDGAVGVMILLAEAMGV